MRVPAPVNFPRGALFHSAAGGKVIVFAAIAVLFSASTPTHRIPPPHKIREFLHFAACVCEFISV